MTDTRAMPDDRVRIERVLPAPIEVVFDAWTNAESMGTWLSPVGHAEVVADPRVDGSFRVVMIDGDIRIEHTGEYLVFDPPRLLSFTWRSPYTGPEPSLVTVTLTPEGEGTRLTLVHERLPVDQVAPHAGGWGTMIDRLAGVLVSTVSAQEEGRPA